MYRGYKSETGRDHTPGYTKRCGNTGESGRIVMYFILRYISYSFPYVPSIFPLPILAEAPCHDPGPVLRVPACALQYYSILTQNRDMHEGINYFFCLIDRTSICNYDTKHHSDAMSGMQRTYSSYNKCSSSYCSNMRRIKAITFLMD